MSPTHGSERLARALASIDDARCAAVDAAVQRRLAAGERADPSRFRDDGPDPLGTGFAWAGGKLPNAATEPVTPAAPTTKSSDRPVAWRYVTYAGGAVLAASLLVAVGLLIGRAGPGGGGREVAFAARVAVVPGELRNGGRQTKLQVANLTDRRAFVTVVGLDAARSPVEYEDGQNFIAVAPGGSRDVELPAGRFGRLTHAVVVLTATPAGEAVVKGIAAAGLPADPAAARERVAADLDRFGFTGAAVDLVSLTPGDR